MQTSEELCIRTGTTDAEDIRVDVWNGSAWVNVFTDLLSGSWNNVSVSSYLLSPTFTIRFTGSSESGDVTQDSWNIDATLLHTIADESSFDYVLRVNNTNAASWQIRLKKYSDANITRLQNCTIYFHNSTDGASSQIIIEDGVYNQDVGSWYDLGDSETIYIALIAKASFTGTSELNVYLEILTPGTTTYAQYILKFHFQ
jgi:hypothetical protein